ncbi:MAG TPA: hypothetical protein VD835_10575 [Pyrinomonadaceae bacterium]|nr:hypothetical protein [Pyrinomonadaceae bacterium]
MMDIEKLGDFAERVVAKVGAKVESIIYYPHPFTQGGLVIVCKDEAGDLLSVVKSIYACDAPDIPVHCLRRRELFKLSLPGLSLTLLPALIDERPHLTFWLRHKGVVLHGRDVRDAVEHPRHARVFLENHIEACMVYMRRHKILGSLMLGNYSLVISEIDKQMRFLMALALLTCGHWDVTPQTTPDLFIQYYADARPKQLWSDFDALRQLDGAPDESASRRVAFKAVRLFENFLWRLREAQDECGD